MATEHNNDKLMTHWLDNNQEGTYYKGTVENKKKKKIPIWTKRYTRDCNLIEMPKEFNSPDRKGYTEWGS